MSNAARRSLYREARRLVRRPKWRRFVRYRGPVWLLAESGAHYKADAEFTLPPGVKSRPKIPPVVSLVGGYTVTWSCG